MINALAGVPDFVIRISFEGGCHAGALCESITSL